MIDAGVWERVEAKLADARPVALAAELVRIPSHPGLPNQELAVARHLAAWLEARGVAARLVEAGPGRPNVLARVGVPDRSRCIVLCGHTDTVPLNADDPGHGFSGEVRDGRLLGRGAA